MNYHLKTLPRKCSTGWGVFPDPVASLLVLVTFFFLSANHPAVASRQQCQGCDFSPELRSRILAAIEDAGFEDRYDAEVWLTDMSVRLRHWIPDLGQRMRLLRAVHREASRADLTPELVLSVIEVESGFDRWAVSSAGAQGLMQVMPFWLKEIGHPEDSLQHVETNLRLGCTILRYYLDKEKGDLRRALGRYNGSIVRNPYPDRVFDALRRRWYRR